MIDPRRCLLAMVVPAERMVRRSFPFQYLLALLPVLGRRHEVDISFADCENDGTIVRVEAVKTWRDVALLITVPDADRRQYMMMLMLLLVEFYDMMVRCDLHKKTPRWQP